MAGMLGDNPPYWHDSRPRDVFAKRQGGPFVGALPPTSRNHQFNAVRCHMKLRIGQQWSA